MVKFVRIVKKNLRKGAHFALMDAFKTVLAEYNFSSARIVTLTESFHERFAAEDLWFEQARASEVIARRRAADTRRDKFYSKLYALVRVWENSEVPEMEQAAAALKKIFRLHKLNVAAQLDSETGRMESLIQQLSTEEMQAHIQTIGGKFLFDEMVVAEELFKQLRLEQGEEQSKKVVGALAKARKECDAAYDAIIRTIEASALVVDDPSQYEAFIKRWNATLKRYKETLNRNQQKRSSLNS